MSITRHMPMPKPVDEVTCAEPPHSPPCGAAAAGSGTVAVAPSELVGVAQGGERGSNWLDDRDVQERCLKCQLSLPVLTIAMVRQEVEHRLAKTSIRSA